MRRASSQGLALVVAAAFWAVDLQSQEPATAVTERLIDQNVTIRSIGHCTVAGVVLAIGRIVAAPTGVEFVPGRCPDDRAKTRVLPEPLTLLGMTAGDALNLLVRLDPRYAWKDAGGVLVLRPIAAWADRQHFLRGKFDEFDIVDEHLGAALGLIAGAIRQGAGAIRQGAGAGLRNWSMRTPQGDRRFTVRLGNVEMIDALNAVVRAHGDLQWRIYYCQPYARAEFANVGLRTHDEDGLASAAPIMRDARTLDTCAVPF